MSSLPHLIARATAAYYRQARELYPTDIDFNDWLDTLDADNRRRYRQQGLDMTCLLPQFQLFCLERRGIYLREFMAARLTPDQFEYWEREKAISDFKPSAPSPDLF
ncbi:hypothetical protein SAMN00120144_3217 [Hymenobacter roseosalivarius DSM 11622]|uniref:Uncharacterized protein n=1 Tax=Hymenobacter roseosalivarius DSM 11622 TaxID=645990 RepID=A0A1W1W2X4_9BACT|nr:hypothetical protein [Hymenobacter roseosalivarius]SMB99967.1 hypothetical protein SAMN00120144_3217 [Hymenobacter roseosalivarius DSM 11622]